MQWRGGTAVITGGGGLLGRGMATTFAGKGMNVVVADLRLEAAEAVAEAVRACGAEALAVETQVADRASMAALAERAYGAFGQVNLLCNNAGGQHLSAFLELTPFIWDKVLGGNLYGVIHGVEAFLPRMIAQGGAPGARHIVNTASTSGVGLADMRAQGIPYVTAKFAVVGFTEGVRPIAAEHGIGMSVLCPGMTVAEPDKPMEHKMKASEWYQDNLLGPLDVAREVVCAVDENRMHIFPHRASRGEVDERHRRLLESFEQAARTSPPMRAGAKTPTP
jgi:NAD(P)-dependent dehydrogenase (short-subunit alcohol dehydrogenase family)